MHTPVITFLNTAPEREWMSDEEKDFRKDAPQYLTEIILNDTLFSKEDVRVHFFQTGVASVVALIEQDQKKFVLKTCFKPERAAMEAAAFLHWNKAGVTTPKVLSQGSIDGYAYFIMEYVDVPVVKDVIEKDPSQKEKYYSQMGHLFYKMHSVSIEGFGSLEIRDGILSGKYATLRETMHAPMTPEIEEALQILENATDAHAVGHFDFSPSHVFTTQPLTVFDPDPEATLPSIDLAFFFLLPRSIEDDALIEMRKTVIRAYMTDSGPIDPQLLAASIVFKAHEKAYNLRLLPSPEREKRAKHMLATVGSVQDAVLYLQKYLDYDAAN